AYEVRFPSFTTLITTSQSLVGSVVSQSHHHHSSLNKQRFETHFHLRSYRELHLDYVSNFIWVVNVPIVYLGHSELPT
ncbi:unnamed protein product, partial [Porites evermanni]